jgi:V/A-type H+/Na+-transporting ATPase subunit D
VRVRHPPGRAGRPWLVHRLEVARRGAELLDDKYRALVHERTRLQPLLASAQEEWELAAREADRWLARATVLAGARQLERLRDAAVPPAEVEIHWQTVVGLRCPAQARLAACPEPERTVLAGSAAALSALQAHRVALLAAVKCASVQGTVRRVESELRLTAVRRNAIERRWIPAHEQALAALELTLEEFEREDAARVRNLVRRDNP